jgi:hypothetical protein
MRTKTAITAALFVAGFFASMTTNVTPAQALTCTQICNNAFQACLLEPTTPKALCTMQRAECLAECP